MGAEGWRRVRLLAVCVMSPGGLNGTSRELWVWVAAVEEDAATDWRAIASHICSTLLMLSSMLVPSTDRLLSHGATWETARLYKPLMCVSPAGDRRPLRNPIERIRSTSVVNPMAAMTTSAATVNCRLDPTTSSRTAWVPLAETRWDFRRRSSRDCSRKRKIRSNDWFMYGLRQSRLRVPNGLGRRETSVTCRAP